MFTQRHETQSDALKTIVESVSHRPTSPTPSSTSSSTVTSPTPAPVSSSSLSSTYSFTPSTEQSQVALPVLMIAGCIVGTCLCGIALAVNHMWRTKTKTRRNEQPVENQQRVSSHKTL